MNDSHIAGINPRLFAGLANGGFDASLSGADLAFREVPIITAIVEDKKNWSLLGAAEKNNSRGYFPSK